MKMKVRILREEYLKSESLYQDFLENTIIEDEDHFSEEEVITDNLPSFPIYLNVTDNEKEKLFHEAIQTLGKYYLSLDREYLLEGKFWYSFLLVNKREYIIEKYPEILESESKFRNIVMKKFDWENYIYKCILIAQYVNDNVDDHETRHRYYDLIINNLDLFNYIIKYEIFRNDKFLLNVMDIVDELQLSEILKKKLDDRPDLGADERVGRRVIYELNKSYPVVLAPMLEKDELKEYFIKNLEKYVDVELGDNDQSNGIISI